MDGHNYKHPPSPPPSYESVVHNHYPNYNHSEPHDESIPGLDEFVNRYEISPKFAEKLRALKGYEIVFICDDSGSMTAPLGEASNSFGKQRTRWDELKETVSIVVDLAGILDPDGVDIYFLNREPQLQVRRSSELEIVFTLEPEGATPIVPVFRQVLQAKRNQIYERNLLILLATDGMPTDERGRPDAQALEHVLRYERTPINQIPVTIIACTDDKDSMEYLNDWDKRIPHLDVVDDYHSEKKEIQARQGRNFPFGFGDYVVKILMGGIDPELDNLDE